MTPRADRSLGRPQTHVSREPWQRRFMCWGPGMPSLRKLPHSTDTGGDRVSRVLGVAEASGSKGQPSSGPTSAASGRRVRRMQAHPARGWAGPWRCFSQESCSSGPARCADVPGHPGRHVGGKSMAPKEQRLLGPAVWAARGGSSDPSFQWSPLAATRCCSGEGPRTGDGRRRPLCPGRGSCRRLARLALVQTLLQAGAGDEQAGEAGRPPSPQMPSRQGAA